MVEEVFDGWTPGLVLDLVQRLPEGSETHAELQGSRDWRDWHNDSWLLVQLINQVIINTYVTMIAAGGKPKKPKLFEGMTEKQARPLDGAKKPQKRGVTLEEVERNFLRFMAAGEQDN